MAVFGVHQGSWKIPFTNIGLPDIGLTEQIARLSGAGFTKQGGSDIIPNLPPPSSLPPSAIQNLFQKQTTNQPPPLKTTTQPSYQPQPQPQIKQSGTPITESEAIKRGWDINKLPSGYYRYQPSGGAIPITEEDALRLGWDINKLPPGYYRYQPPEDMTAKVRGAIESAYAGVVSALDEIAGLVPQRRAEEEARLKEFLQTQTQALEGQKQTSLSNLDIARQQVEQEVGKSKEDIYSSLRNLLQASQQKLGLAGAGQSSASEVMLPYALGKQAGRSLGQVQAQAIKQFNEIEAKKNDVINTYNLAVNQLNQDYLNNLREVANRYNAYLDEIRMKKAGANQQKQLALARLEEGIMNLAYQEALNFRNTMLQRQMVVEDWARNRLAQLNNFKLQLAQSGNFNPQDIVYSELQGLEAEMSPTLVTQGDWAAILASMQGRKRWLDDILKQTQV